MLFCWFSAVDIIVELKDASETVQPAVKQEIEEAAEEEVIAQWLDISVFYQVAGRQRVKLEKAYAKVQMSLIIPEELRTLASSGAVFELLCVADGKIVRIPTGYDPLTGRLSFLTDIFGIFALVYTLPVV